MHFQAQVMQGGAAAERRQACPVAVQWYLQERQPGQAAQEAPICCCVITQRVNSQAEVLKGAAQGGQLRRMLQRHRDDHPRVQTLAVLNPV